MLFVEPQTENADAEQVDESILSTETPKSEAEEIAVTEEVVSEKEMDENDRVNAKTVRIK